MYDIPDSYIQCNLDLMALDLLATILKIFNLDTSCDLVTVFLKNESSVTKDRLR